MGVSKSLELDEEIVNEREKLREDKRRRERLLTEAFGIDAGRITSFGENDRGENRS